MGAGNEVDEGVEDPGHEGGVERDEEEEVAFDGVENKEVESVEAKGNRISPQYVVGLRRETHGQP